MSKIGFLFYGRLEKEKGFDALLETIEIFGNQNKNFPFEIYIFGKGSMEADLMKLCQKYKSIRYFGRQTLDNIKRYLPNISYVLMPSSFLETFGLSALNALSRGLPVIGFQKGGLTPFVLSPFDLSKMSGISTAWKLYNMINKIIYNPPTINTQSIVDISNNYTQDIWLKKFKKIFISKSLKSETASIAMISDFASKIGGIETYIHDVNTLLSSKGYHLDIAGYNLSNNKFTKILKYIFMFVSLFNFVSYFQIQKQIKKQNPDVIRFHSIIRRIGRMGILATKFSSAPKFIMFHDFGYFFPFPHSLTSTDQIVYPLTLSNFIKSARTDNILKIIAVAFKYFSIILIKNQIKKSDFNIIVPSDFMREIVSKSYDIPKSKIITLPHFIQS